MVSPRLRRKTGVKGIARPNWTRFECSSLAAFRQTNCSPITPIKKSRETNPGYSQPISRLICAINQERAGISVGRREPRRRALAEAPTQTRLSTLLARIAPALRLLLV